MRHAFRLKPIKKILGTIRLPGSKSISNRALLLSALAEGRTHLTNFLHSDDTGYMLRALQSLGIRCIWTKKKHTCSVYGAGKRLISAKTQTLFLGNAGTVLRPLTAILSLQSTPVVLTGETRMKQRPIRHLVDALRQGGARIVYAEKEFFPPVKVSGGLCGGNIQVDGHISSQFLTSLLMALPLSNRNSLVHVRNQIVSKPYLKMTLSIMKKFGIVVRHQNYRTFSIEGNQQYRSPKQFCIEGDASSASYFLAAAAIKGKTARVVGINRKSIQGDIGFVDILRRMGTQVAWGTDYIECSRRTLHAVDVDVNHIPDAAMTLAIVALFVKKKTTLLRNIYNWRMKETDRLHAMSCELRKLGALVHEGKSHLSITPPRRFKPATIETYNDHRMAMCFSLVALSNQPVTILNPQCVNKTFPHFFRCLSSIGVQ